MIAAGVREILGSTGIGEGGQMAAGETRAPDASALTDGTLRFGGCGVRLTRTAIGVLAVLMAVLAVALLGGVVPAVLDAIVGVFIVVAVVVSLLAGNAARGSRQAARAAAAARPIAEADQMRT